MRENAVPCINAPELDWHQQPFAQSGHFGAAHSEMHSGMFEKKTLLAICYKLINMGPISITAH